MHTSDSVGMPVLPNGAEYPASHNNNFSQAETVIEHRRCEIEPPGYMFSIGDFGFDSMGFMDLSQNVPSTGMDWIFCNSLPDTSMPLLSVAKKKDSIAGLRRGVLSCINRPSGP